MFTAAVVQLNSNRDERRNMEHAERHIRAAARAGAAFVATPENTNFLGPQADKVSGATTLEGEVCSTFSALARELSIHLLLGSFNERCDDPTKCFNTSVLFGPDGARLAVYRKIHLFDVQIPGKVNAVESHYVAPGSEIVTVPTAHGRVGLSICYDLRFPELYLALNQGGAELIMVPSAFTAPTGAAHWEVLVRARAIESQAFVLAPAQVGRHDDEGLRESFGHAMIIDPWGRVLAELAEGTGFVSATIDMDEVLRVREQIPVNTHRRLKIDIGRN